MTITRAKAKPIFKEEKDFVESKLNLKLPDNCWIDGGGTKFIWLDIYSKIPLLKFKVEMGGKFLLLKDNREKLKDYQQQTISDILKNEKDRLICLLNDAISRTVEYINANPNKFYSISLSGGKDSDLVRYVWKSALKKIKVNVQYEYIFFNTSNEVADVYKHIKQIKNEEESNGISFKIINPKVGWREWIKNNKYMFPNIFKRSCCSVYKEGQLKKQYDKNLPLVNVIGVRKYESSKRAKYDFMMDYDWSIANLGSFDLPKNWTKLSPIINFRTIDVWLLLLLLKFPINKRYKIGHSRVGCLICPYSSTYEDELNKIYYSHQYNWFVTAMTQNYINTRVDLLHYSLDEWINGAWKIPTSKYAQLIQSKPTDENIQKYANLKNISFEMAKKFFNNNTCGNCGSKLREQDIAMFYKTYGRKENEVDNRKPLCKKCFCKENNITSQEYTELTYKYFDEGCELF